MQSSQLEVGPGDRSSALEKIEVLVEGTDQVLIRYLTYTEGLGWCTQKTLKVDPEQLDDLHRALTVARHRISARRVDRGEVVVPARVIKLPSVA